MYYNHMTAPEGFACDNMQSYEVKQQKALSFYLTINYVTRRPTIRFLHPSLKCQAHASPRYKSWINITHSYIYMIEFFDHNNTHENLFIIFVQTFLDIGI